MKSCKDVHRLVILGQDKKLGVAQRVAVWVHLMMCSACRRFEAQMDLLSKAVRRFPGD